MNRRRALVGIGLALAVIATLYAQDRLAIWFIEDAAISFAYAQNLAEGWGLVRFPGDERVEGYSNPLWVFWMALWHVLGWDGFVSSKWTAWLLPFATLPAVAAVVARVRGAGWGVLAAWLLALDATFVIWSASGLENSLFCALLALGLWRSAVEGERGRWLLAPLFWLALALTRPEGVVYAALGGGWALLLEATGQRRWRRVVAWAAVFWVPFAAYHKVRYDYFAYAFPATYYAKIGEDPFRPFLWHGGSWAYLRNYGDDMGRFWLLPVFFAGVAGLKGKRAWVVGAASLAVAVVLLYPGVEPFFRWGWLDRAPLPAGWVQLRIATLVAVVLAVSGAGIGAEGWRTRLLAWGTLAIGLLFCLRSGGDWMRGYRWLSLVSVPAAVLFALGVSDVFDRLRTLGRTGTGVGGALVTLLVLAEVGPQASYLVHYEPETTPFSVRKRVRHYTWAAKKLHLDYVDVLDHDMGAMLFWGRDLGIVRDSRGLIDIPFALHRMSAPFIDEYAYREYSFDFAHAHASTGSAVRRQVQKWRDLYIEMPGYGNNNLHVANYVKKSHLIDRWTGPSDRAALFAGGGRRAILHGLSIPAPEVSPGSWLYLELGLQLPERPEGTRLFLFLFDEVGVEVSWSVPLGLEDWYPVESWQPDESFVGRVALPLDPGLKLGAYQIGAVVVGPGGVVPARDASPDPLFMEGEIRFPGRAVELVGRRRMGAEAADDLERSIQDAEANHCIRAETWWRRARAHRAVSTDWLAHAKKRVFPHIARCFARRGARYRDREDAAAAFRQARRYSRTDPEVVLLGEQTADRWIAVGQRLRSEGDLEGAYGHFRDALYAAPQRAWARRWAEELRVERLDLPY